MTISNFDTNDRIVINGLGGDDAIVASGLTGMQLTVNGGDGADVLIGGAGNDILNGDAGDDVLIGGPGVDVLDGGPGNNVNIQSIVAASHVRTLPLCWASSWHRASSRPAMAKVRRRLPRRRPAQQPLLAQPHA